MNYEAVKYAYEHGPKNKTDAAVFLALCTYANLNTLQSWPSIETLVEGSRTSTSTVQRSLRRLEEGGFITKVSSGVGGRGRTTKYQIVMRNPVNVTRYSASKPGHADRVHELKPGHSASKPGHSASKPGHSDTRRDEEEIKKNRGEDFSENEKRLSAERASELCLELGLRVPSAVAFAKKAG